MKRREWGLIIIGLSIGLILAWVVRVGAAGWIANGHDLAGLGAHFMVLAGGLMIAWDFR